MAVCYTRTKAEIWDFSDENLNRISLCLKYGNFILDIKIGKTIKKATYIFINNQQVRELGSLWAFPTTLMLTATLIDTR